MRFPGARLLGGVLLIAVLPVGRALAHTGESAGTADPGWLIAVSVPLLLAAFAYLSGLRRAWRRAGFGRGVRSAEAASAATGIAVLALMLAWPLHAWGRLRFAPHMVEHELLTVLAAPLLAAARPGLVYLLALPLSWRRVVVRRFVNGGLRRFWRPLLHPGVACALQGAVLWLWHAPPLFEAALRSEPIHFVQHATLLASALLFWASILPRRADSSLRITAVFLLFATSIHTTLLSALLTLSPTVWYASYRLPGNRDEYQQLAGVIMWVPGGVVYVIAALALCAAFLLQRPDYRPPPRLGTPAPQS